MLMGICNKCDVYYYLYSLSQPRSAICEKCGSTLEVVEEEASENQKVIKPPSQFELASHREL